MNKPDFDYLARGLSCNPGWQIDIAQALRDAYDAGERAGRADGLERASELIDTDHHTAPGGQFAAAIRAEKEKGDE